MKFMVIVKASKDSEAGKVPDVEMLRARHAGALEDPADGAVLCFKGDSPEVAERFAKNDPYVVNGLVTRWRVRTWNTVAGPLAANPVPAPGAQS